MSTLLATAPRSTEDPPSLPPSTLRDSGFPEDPKSTRYAASIARSVAFTLLRAAHGERVPRHLSSSVSRESLEKIQTRLALVQGKRTANPGAPLALARLRVGRTRVVEVSPGIFECVVLCHSPESVRACALRLSRDGGRWRVLDFEFA